MMRKYKQGLLQKRARECMSPDPVTVGRDRLAAEALNLMEDRKITALIVKDARRARSRGSSTSMTSGARRCFDAGRTSGPPRIRMILMDVDGTLTDGCLFVLPDGEEVKSYNVRDGLGILLAHQAGIKTGIITGKTAKSVERRAEKLRIGEVHQGILDKKPVLDEISGSPQAETPGDRLHRR